MTKDIGLNSTAFFTIAQTMRDQNKEPDELMPYSEYGAASATYAVIKAMESIATGLWEVEQRRVEEARAAYLAQIDRMKAEQEWRESIIAIDPSDGDGR